MKKNIIISPSIIASDFSDIKAAVKKVETAEIDFLHFDIMDGNFVPNITIGPDFVKAVRKISDLKFDVHLMISHPEEYVEKFIESGADWLSFHIEAYNFPLRIIKKIKELNKKSGIVLNPATPVKDVEQLLEYLDYVLIMTVDPGFSGQKFIPFSLKKIETLKNIIVKKNYSAIIEVDGGINEETVDDVVNAGADMLVMGYAFFKNDNYIDLIRRYRR